MALPWENPGGGPPLTFPPVTNPPPPSPTVPPVPSSGWNRPPRPRPDMTAQMQAWLGARPTRPQGPPTPEWTAALEAWRAQKPEWDRPEPPAPSPSTFPPRPGGGQPPNPTWIPRVQGTAGNFSLTRPPGGGGISGPYEWSIRSPTWGFLHGPPITRPGGPGGPPGPATPPDPTQVGSGTPGLTDWQTGRRGFGSGWRPTGTTPPTTGTTGTIPLTGKAAKKAAKKGLPTSKVPTTAPKSVLSNAPWTNGLPPMVGMPGFQFPQYTQQWAMNPDIFGRVY